MSRGKPLEAGTKVFEDVWDLLYILFYGNNANLDTYSKKDIRSLLESSTQCLWGEKSLGSKFSFLFESWIDEFPFWSRSWIVNKRLFERIRLKIFNNYRRIS